MSQRLIIHTEASHGRGGQEARIFSEMEYLRAQGYECVLMAPRQADLFARSQAAGFRCVPVPFTKLSQLGDFFFLRHFFVRHRPLVVGTHSSVDSRVALLAAASAGVPVRVRYRHVSTPTRGNFFNRYLYRRLCHAVVTTGDCISDALASEVRIPRAKIHTIATGIQPPAVLMERAQARSWLQAQLSLPAQAHFVGMMAELRSWKGHCDLMEALGAVLEKFPHLHLVFVGGGETLDFYRRFAAGLPWVSHIHFVGHQKNFYDYFCAWDAALLASTRNEGIPQTLLHAMFAGTPVIGTRVGGIPEIVADGLTGLLVPPGTPPALAQAMVATLSDPAAAQARAKAALAHAQRHHTWEVMGQKIVNLIESLSK